MTHNHPKLILLEGLPGSGKSTNSRIIMSSIDQLGKRVKWFHEVARPHPTLFFNEANLTKREYQRIVIDFPEDREILEKIKIEMFDTISIDLLELEWHDSNHLNIEVLRALENYNVWTFPLQQYIAVALEKWQYFVEKVKREKDLVVILDSSIFQFQIYTFLLENSPYQMIESFVKKLFSIISELDPTLILLTRENVEDALLNIERSRGIDFMETIWKRDSRSPYYHNRPPGAEGYREFLRDYHVIVQRLFDITAFKKLNLDISEGDWKQYVSEMLLFLEIRESDVKYQMNFPIGIYENNKLDLKLEILEGYLVDPTGKKKRLIPRNECELYIDDLPVILRLEESNKITVKGGQLIDRWTTLNTEFLKVE
ncbi:hypothetical protein ACFSO7_07400 [Bacillus sp. CGMCC 1.16607]|uniref:hypothetical protein n=1 Tax=Bacillus sp. CGMCC 1.16607 TaxID=3351842 RepID=UPI0036345921